MRKRHKILLGFIGGCIVLTAVFTIGMKYERLTPASEENNGQETGNEQSYSMPKTNENQQPNQQTNPAESEESQYKSKYEVDVKNDLQMDLSYIADFIGQGKQFILKRQIQVLVEEAKSVRCLEYQRSVPEDMRMEFFFLLDTGEILKGYYSYSNRETSVERTNMTEDDVWGLKEAEEKALESEAQAKLDAERKAQQEAERIQQEQEAMTNQTETGLQETET